MPDFCVDLVYEAPPDGKARCNQQHPERNALVQITALLFVQVINVLFDLGERRPWRSISCEKEGIESAAVLTQGERRVRTSGLFIADPASMVCVT